MEVDVREEITSTENKQTHKRKAIRNINILFIIIIIFYIAGSKAVSYLGAVISLPLSFYMIIGEVLIIVPVIIWLIISRTNPIKAYRFTCPKISSIAYTILICICLTPLLMFLNLLSSLFSENQVSGVMELLQMLPLFLQFSLIAIIPAFVEEFVFRGVYFHTYRKNGRLLPAILLSGLLFGMMHMNINQISYAVPLGIIFAFIVEASGSIWTSILYHLCINGTSVILSYIMNRYWQTTDTTAAAETVFGLNTYSIGLLFIILAFAVAGAVLAFLLYRAMARSTGRWESIKSRIRERKSTDSSPIIDIWFLLSIILCFIYMFI